MIEVIEQSTSDREKEIKCLFKEAKPLLDEGHSFTNALKLIGHPVYNYHTGWFKHFVEYARTQGYEYNQMRGRRKWKE